MAGSRREGADESAWTGGNGGQGAVGRERWGAGSHGGLHWRPHFTQELGVKVHLCMWYGYGIEHEDNAGKHCSTGIQMNVYQLRAVHENRTELGHVTPAPAFHRVASRNKNNALALFVYHLPVQERLRHTWPRIVSEVITLDQATLYTALRFLQNKNKRVL